MPLILKRRPGESVLLTTEQGVIEILYCGTQDGTKNARLLITAPDCVAIARSELKDTHVIEQRAFAAKERKHRGV